MKLAILQVRSCPECAEFLSRHPTIGADSRSTEQRLGKPGAWIHRSASGKCLHALAVREKSEAGVATQ